MIAAERYIQMANDNLEMKNYDLVIVAAYTSMFHSGRAILFKDGITERSHICLWEYLKKTYPYLKSFINTIDSYRSFRHTAIYGLEILINKDDAKEAIKTAEFFVEKAKKII